MLENWFWSEVRCKSQPDRRAGKEVDGGNAAGGGWRILFRGMLSSFVLIGLVREVTDIFEIPSHTSFIRNWRARLRGKLKKRPGAARRTE